ncbi:MAG: hypothetical protein K0Q52_365 [Microbacterium sp.]|nr:hypothetical protein [Microbacterium sp.]
MARTAAERDTRTQPHQVQHRSPDPLPLSSRTSVTTPASDTFRDRHSTAATPSQIPSRWRRQFRNQMLRTISDIHLMRHPRSSTAPAGRRLRVHADGAVAPEDGLCLHPAPADPAVHHLRPAAAPEPQAHPSDVQLEGSPVVRRVSSEGAGSGPSVLAYLSRLRARTTTYPCSFRRGGAIQRC